MDINVLRSRLLFYLSDDLKNLTVTDLKECNWRTSRLIFSAIIFSSKTLRDIAEDLTQLSEERTRKLNLLRGQSNSRDEKKVFEEEYRHSFFTLVLQCLEHLQYPPTLEPFSDPLSSLKDIVAFRLSAIQYLCDNAVAEGGSVIYHSDHDDRSSTSHSRHNERAFTTEEVSSTKQTRSSMTASTPPCPPSPSNSTSRSTADTSVSSGNSRLTSSTNKNNKLIAPRCTASSGTRHQVPPSPDSLLLNTSEVTLENVRCDDRFSEDNKYDSKHQHSLGEYDTLRKAFEILQYHNEQLSKQLKLLQDSVCERNAMEVKMDLLMRDFSGMVSEVADISNAPSDKTSDTREPFPPPQSQSQTSLSSNSVSSSNISSLTKSHQNNKSRPIGSIIEEKSASSAAGTRRRPASGSHIDGGVSTLPSTGASSIHWKHLQARIKDVHTRWNSMRREAKASVLAVLSVHSAASQCRDGFLPTQQRSPLQERQRTTSSRGSGGGGGGGIASRSLLSTSTTARSFTPTKKTNTSTATGARSSVNAISYNGSSPSACVHLHKILGVQLPLSFEVNSNHSGSSSSGAEVGLDVPRVHQLQRDIVTFARSAYSYAQSCQVDEAHLCDGSRDVSSLERLKEMLLARCTHMKALVQLRDSAKNLLLHTACLSPFLPLHCAPPSLSSSKTGLDALFDLVFPLLEAKKLWSRDIQAAFDRTKSEQYSLLVAVTHSEIKMKQWQTFANQINPLISSFANKLSEHCRSAIKELQDKTERLSSLSESLLHAEQSRMTLPHADSGPVNPLEALARGYFGQDVADLIIRVRMFDKDFMHLCGGLKAAQIQLLADIAVEVTSLIKCGDALSKLSTS